MCVGLSRAKNGFLLIRRTGITDGKFINAGAKGWKTLIDDHRKGRAFVVRDSLPGSIAEIEKQLGLRGPQ